MSPQNTILSRIKKLLNLTTDRGATPDEAANAAAKVQALLLEHNLSMGQVHDYNADVPTEKVEGQSHAIPLKNKAKWRRALYYVAAKHTFCDMIKMSGRGCENDVYFFGKPSNIAVCLYMGEYLCREIATMGAKARRDAYQGSQFETSFCYGAVSMIDTRLKAQEAAQQAASSACTALVVQSKGELTAAMNKMFPKRSTLPGRKPTLTDAYELGRERAKAIPLSKGIGSTSTTARRLA